MLTKTIRKRVLLVVALGALLVGGVAANAARQALGVAAGYSAKLVASSVFVSGRNESSVLEQELAPASDLERSFSKYIQIRVDRAQRRVSATALGLVTRTAVCRESLGCALAIGVSPDELQKRGPMTPAPALPPETAWPFGTRVDAAEGWTEAALDAAFIPGAHTRAVVIVHEGRIVGERYAPGFDADTPLQGWSMAKSVIGALAGVLADEGRLELDQPTGLVEWQDERAGITLDQLLRMSSGLEFDETYVSLVTDPTRMLFGSPSAAAYALRKPLEVPPDSRWSYSSGTSNIVSLLIRKTFESDDAYWSFPQHALFGPVGMHSAVLETDAAGMFVGSSFMYATARDWARFGQLLIQDGVWGEQRILPAGWVEYSTTPTPGAPLGRYGAHIWLNAGELENPERRSFPRLPRDLYYLAGFRGQRVVVLPSRNLVVVRLGLTKNEDTWSMESHLMLPLLNALSDTEPDTTVRNSS